MISLYWSFLWHNAELNHHIGASQKLGAAEKIRA